MDKITMDFLNDSVLALFGRADFVGGIDNEALDFGQLESFVHLPAINTSSNNGNSSAITLAITAVATTPAHTITTASASNGSANATTHGTLPESPPDSGSEPPYSPTDLHAISNLNPMAYHHYSTNSQSANAHHLDQAMHVNETTSVDCHTGAIVTNASIHKTGDILLSSTAMPLSNSVTNMMLPANDMLMHQNIGVGMHHPISMGGRNNMYRGDSNSLLTLNAEDDFSCLMNDPMFQLSTNGMNGHQNNQQTATSHAYNPHMLAQMPTSVATSHSNEIPHLINSRKRTMAQPNEYNAQVIIDAGADQQMANVIPIKRSTSVILPSIKPEPNVLSPSCVSALIEPDTPPSKSSVDVCSNISSCNTSITSPVSTSIMIPSMADSPTLQQQGQNQQANGNNMDNGSNDSFPMQCIRFSPFQQQNWHILCDQSLQELPLPHYRVDADKGFNFSNSDDAFVCQKKNHFQITCHAQAQGAAAIFVRTESGLEKIKSFHLHFYGVKLETPTQTIRIEQSQSDRSKKPFHPVPIDLQSRQVSKITVGRLHFSETTSNNMRKKGRPNPEQRYFQLVVGLHAHTHSGNFPVISQGSERIIVRASNPGQFESDVELCWQRGVTQDSIFTHASRVGINTDRPDESLVVHGNLKVSGHIVHPSDSRAKQEIGELDTSQQLQNVKRIRVVKYRYDPDFAAHHGLINVPAVHSTKYSKENEQSNASTEQSNVIDVIDTGVIAQEIREVLPDAVQETGSVLLPNGEVIDNFLVVNKDRIYMENIGAVKELCKVTGSLETRIEQLERMNSRLVHVRKIDHKSDCSHSKCKFGQCNDDLAEPCSNKMIQITIVVLVIIMAICLAAISTLYFVEHKQNDHYHLRRYENTDMYLGHSALVNNSHGTGGGFTAGGNVSFNSNYLNEKSTSKKGHIKAAHHNTQNASLIQQQTSVTSVELAPNPVPKSNNDLDNQFHVTTQLQVTPEELEGELVSPINESIDETISKQPKITLNKYENAVTTEKLQLKGDKLGENFSSIPEPHEVSSSNDIYNDESANFIDVGQQPSRNDTKPDDNNVAKSKFDIDTTNHLIPKDSIFESEYHREKKVLISIGMPAHCEPGVSKTNRTISDCQSLCTANGPEMAKVSDMPEVQEIAMPENVDIIETSTKAKNTATTKLLPVDPKTEQLTTLGKILNSMVEQTTAKDKSETPIAGASIADTKSKVNKIAIQAEQPVEIRESSMKLRNASAPILSANYSEKSEASDHQVDTVDIPKNPNKPREDGTSADLTLEAEPFAHSSSSKLLENDIKPSFHKKTENKFDKALPDDGVDVIKLPNSNMEQLATFASPQMTTSTPAYGMAVESANAACILIYLQIRSESFNITLGSDKICHNFNITYIIPLSKYMKENRFELVFLTQNSLQWTLCSMKESTTKENHKTNDDPIYSKGIASRASFEVEIPPNGDFERQLEFQANLQPSENACRSPALVNGNPLQTVSYKINIYRDCTQ